MHVAIACICSQLGSSFYCAETEHRNWKQKISKSGFEIRQEKNLVLINNAVRALNSPRNTFPVFESVGKDLSTTITASQLNRIASDWGVSTTHITATETNGISGDVYTDAFNAELATHQTDSDIHSIRNTSDNVGKGSANRFETRHSIITFKDIADFLERCRGLRLQEL